MFAAVRNFGPSLRSQRSLLHNQNVFPLGQAHLVLARRGLAVEDLEGLAEGHVTYLALICSGRAFDMQGWLSRVVHCPFKVLFTLSHLVFLASLGR